MSFDVERFCWLLLRFVLEDLFWIAGVSFWGS